MHAWPRHNRIVWLLALVAVAACGPNATPQLIGSHLRQPAVTLPPPSVVVVSDGELTVRVADVTAAAEQAAALSYDHGGYVSEVASWYVDGQLHEQRTLQVPLATFDAVYAAIGRLGTVESERLHNTLAYPGSEDPWRRYTSLRVHFAPHEPAVRLPRLPSFGWSPLHTFRSAFAVFAAIATFIVDIAIWLAVVIGPFVLLGLGLRALVRRWRPRP